MRMQILEIDPGVRVRVMLLPCCFFLLRGFLFHRYFPWLGSGGKASPLPLLYTRGSNRHISLTTSKTFHCLAQSNSTLLAYIQPMIWAAALPPFSL
jgi:hypothetical protein